MQSERESLMRRFVRTSVAVLSAAAVSLGGMVAVGAGTAQAAAQTSSYVSLGDSLAFGYQPNLVAAGDFNPADYVGYAEDFAAMRPHLQLANFGCPGETSSSLIDGGCPWLQAGHPLHVSYSRHSSQLAAAVAYLVAHPDTSLISIDIGSNDLLALVGLCGSNQTCVADHVTSVVNMLVSNYSDILSALHRAAPQAELVVFNLYNPLALSQLGSDALVEQVNQAIRGVANTFGASVADAFSAINGNAGSPAEHAFICTRTWKCKVPPDIHPTDLGYRQMAIALLHAVVPG